VVEVAIGLVKQPEWARGPARIEGREVILDESRAEPYGLYESEQAERMAFDLAAIALHKPGPDPREIKAFIRRYGLLWHGADKLGSGECRESLDAWRLEAEKLSTVLYFSTSLGDASREGSAAPVRRLFERAGVRPLFERFASNPTDEAYIMAATEIAAGQLNQGLQGGMWELAPAGPGELRLAFYAPNLVSAAYANVGALVARKAEFKECPGCGRIFPPKSGKQAYHDEQCATRARQRRWKRGQSESS
jgi:hypothetical protein